jgi:hypothetical protein
MEDFSPKSKGVKIINKKNIDKQKYKLKSD